MDILSDDDRRLRSGRVVSANGGYIGINEALVVSHGYDDEMPCDEAQWTAEERQELAEHMISLWRRFASGGR